MSEAKQNEAEVTSVFQSYALVLEDRRGGGGWVRAEKLWVGRAMCLYLVNTALLNVNL